MSLRILSIAKNERKRHPRLNLPIAETYITISFQIMLHCRKHNNLQTGPRFLRKICIITEIITYHICSYILSIKPRWPPYNRIQINNFMHTLFSLSPCFIYSNSLKIILNYFTVSYYSSCVAHLIGVVVMGNFDPL